MIGKICIRMLILLVAGCAVQSPYDRSYVSEGIKERTDYELGQVTEPGQSSYRKQEICKRFHKAGLV